MKTKMLIIVAVGMLSGGAWADTPCTTCNTTTSSDSAQKQKTTVDTTSQAAATNAGNSQAITFTSPGNTETNVHYSGTQTVKNVPSVNAPPLVSSNDTCMGSISGAASVAGFGGAFGKTVIDENCVMLKNSRELWNMGMRAAGLARMCMDDNNKEALEITGFECPQTTRAKNKAEAERVRLDNLKNSDPAAYARETAPKTRFPSFFSASGD